MRLVSTLRARARYLSGISLMRLLGSNEDQTTTAELHRRARTESWYSSSSKAKKNVIAPQTTTHHDIRVYFTNETRFVGIV